MGDPGGDGGRPCQGRQTPNDSGTRKLNEPTLAGRRTTALAKAIGGRPWRGLAGTRKTSLVGKSGRDASASGEDNCTADTADDSGSGRRGLRRGRRCYFVTHHARHGEVGEAEHKTRSSPASGGCGWVPRYEDGAIHDHSMGGRAVAL